MNDFFAQSATAGVVLSLIAYGIGLRVRKRWPKPYLQPLLIAILLVMAFLLGSGVDYDNYRKSAHYLSYLLTPATVSLAIPLYTKLELLKRQARLIVLAILLGVLASLGSIALLSYLFGLSHETYLSLLPKSITTAIGMGVSEEIGGQVTLTVASIIVTGIFGNMVAESFCRLLGLKSPLARGLAIGTAAHAIGTVRAMEMGETEGALSGLAIVVAGLMTVLLAPIFVAFY